MIIDSLRIPGCYKITPKIIGDKRGEFVKTFVESEFQRINLETQFREEYFSRSRKRVLRGMHFQIPPYEFVKLVRCLAGRVRDVIFDIRVGSPTYGTYDIYELDGNEAVSLYLPAGIAHGFVALSEMAVVSYKVTSEYVPSHDCGIHWNSFGVEWGIKNPIVSSRDEEFIIFSDYLSPFIYKKG